MVRILVVGDLHERRPSIKIEKKDFDAFILVGDVADDSKLSPYTKKWFRYLKEHPKEKISLHQFLIKKIGKRKLEQFEKDSLKKGNEILRYLDSFGKPIFMVPGNWDQSYGNTRIKDMDKNDYNYLKSFYDFWLGDKINKVLIKGIKNLKSCQYRNYVFNGVNILGYGLVSAPEDLSHKRKKLKRNLNEKQIERLKKAYSKILSKLDKTFKKRDKKLPTLFISHNIPYGIKLDKITDKKSYAYKKHLGSIVARKFCTKYQPLVCVGGHIHDHKGKDKIKRTTVVNPGFGKNAQVLVEIDSEKKKIKKIKFLK